MYETLRAAFAEYAAKCYQGRLSDVQAKEVEQAFLSGIHWCNTEPEFVPCDALHDALAKRLREIGSIK